MFKGIEQGPNVIIFNLITSLTYILCSKFLSAFLLLILGTICSLFLLVCEHVYVRYIRKAVTQTHKKGQNSRKTNCFSVLRKVTKENSVVVVVVIMVISSTDWTVRGLETGIAPII